MGSAGGSESGDLGPRCHQGGWGKEAADFALEPGVRALEAKLPAFPSI